MKIRVRHAGYFILFIIYLFVVNEFYNVGFSFESKKGYDIIMGALSIIGGLIMLGVIIYYIVENENKILFKTK